MSRASSESAFHDASAASAITVIEMPNRKHRSSSAGTAVRPGDWKTCMTYLERHHEGDEQTARDQTCRNRRQHFVPVGVR